MNSFRRYALVSILAICVMALFVGCKGDTGPTGSPGAQGDPGAQGPQGEPGEDGDPGGGGSTRTVRTGSVHADSSVYTIPIQGLSLLDPPLVSVFIDIEGFDEWDELPVPYTDGADNDIVAYASITDGGVVLYNCNAFPYIMIIIE